jgi:hypothetical protein
MSEAANRRWRQKMLSAHLREKDRAALQLLRARVKMARVERAQLLHTARMSCRTARAELVERQRAERAAFVARQRLERADERSTCESGKQSARSRGDEGKQQARRELVAERASQRLGRAIAKKQAKPRSSARERQQEDDEAVRNNLPDTLRAAWDRHKRNIRGNDNKSRTEAFLEWAEENADELVYEQAQQSDREIRALLKQQKEANRTVRNARRYKLPPEELEKLLAEVPF